MDPVVITAPESVVVDPGADPATPPEDPATPPSETPDLAAEVEKWKQLSRKNEDRAKTNSAAAARLKEIEDANKSEVERITDELAESRLAAAETAAEAARLRAAVKHGLSEDDLALIGTGTPEEIEDRAAKLAARLEAAGIPPTPGTPGERTKRTPYPDRGQGAPTGETPNLDALIADAQAKGDVRLAISLTNQKLAEIASKS